MKTYLLISIFLINTVALSKGAAHQDLRKPDVFESRGEYPQIQKLTAERAGTGCVYIKPLVGEKFGVVSFILEFETTKSPEKLDRTKERRQLESFYARESPGKIAAIPDGYIPFEDKTATGILYRYKSIKTGKIFDKISKENLFDKMHVFCPLNDNPYFSRHIDIGHEKISVKYGKYEIVMMYYPLNQNLNDGPIFVPVEEIKTGALFFDIEKQGNVNIPIKQGP